MNRKKFNYSNLEELQKDIKEQELEICTSSNVDILQKKVMVENFEVPNSLSVHPMEGCDGNADGTPGPLTIRRYKRFAAGGAGLLWLEAVAVVEEGKANPRHLYINDQNVEAFKDLFETIQESAKSGNSQEHTPLCIMQLTHAGRFSKPYANAEPVIAYHNQYLNEKFNIDPSHKVITDEELVELEDSFVHAAKLAKEAGFNGVDVKSCHRYLLSELLSAYDREGKYGGSFENRTRFIIDVVTRIKAELGDDFIVATRMNLYDGIPYPFGWGVDKDDYRKYDLEEPIKLIKILYDLGVRLVNVTMGTPYYNPHVNRPYDNGGYISEETQLVSIDRLISGAGAIQKLYDDLVVVGTGYSWFRHLMPYIAAGSVENNLAKIVGMGRGAFAYPDYAKDILTKGKMDKYKSCITCSKCTELMRTNSVTGCIIRDQEEYLALYREKCLKK